jgi:hypothetical protein
MDEHPSQSQCVTVTVETSTSERHFVDTSERRYAEEYNAADVAHILRTSQTTFEAFNEHQNRLGEEPYAPFENEDEWELAKFLIKKVSQTAADYFLKLPIVSGQRALRVQIN